MANAVPKYLREIAEVKESNAEKLNLKISCPCGCSRFIVSKNITKNLLTKEEKRQIRESNKWEKEFMDRMVKKYGYDIVYGGIEEETYHEFTVNKLVNGTKTGKLLESIRVETGQIPISTKEHVNLLRKKDSTVIYKVLCTDCSKEYLLFDSRIHGNDAAEEKTQLLEEYKFKPKKIGGFDAPVEIIISIKNFWDFNDIAGNGNEGLTADDYSEMFGHIQIKAITAGKTISIFSEDLG